MTREPRISEELRNHVDPGTERDLDALATRLESERPRPRPGFRAELRRHLIDLTSQPGALRPVRLRLLVSAYLMSGFALLAIAAIGLAGAGPLGY